MNKVILISVDGTRPDGLLGCGNRFVEEMKKRGSYTLDARSVVPPVTLPAHLSIFHSIPPARHGITTNTFTPFVRPVSGLFEQICLAGGKCAMFYGWEPLRDVARPKSLSAAGFVSARSEENTDVTLTDMALDCIEKRNPDFVFLYLVETDEKGGHDNGWMSNEYLRRISVAVDQIRRIIEQCGNSHTIIVTADHGGHDRTHGLDIPEDMTIPMFFFGDMFSKGKELHGINLLDIAPTVADIMGVLPAEEWEGKSVLDNTLRI